MAILGGHAVQAERLLRAWEGDPQVQVRLIPINPPPPPLLARFASIRYARTAATQLSYWPSLLREVAQVDVVHVFATSNSSFFLSAAPAILAAHTLRRSVVVNYRGDTGEHLARSRAARCAIASAQSVVVPSTYFLQIFTALGLRAGIVPNIADLSQFRYRPRAPGGRCVLSTRNFEPIYNVDCTIQAFAHVQRRYPDASLTVAGGGSCEPALRSLVGELGLRNVTFTGRVPPDRMHSLYDAADIYVQTPLVDNMPGSLVEAFASGVPVVATAVGGVPALMEHGKHGLLTRSRDAAAVAEHIIELMEDHEAAQRMAAAAVETCRAYAADRVREQWRSVYSALVPASTLGAIESTEAQRA